MRLVLSESVHCEKNGGGSKIKECFIVKVISGSVAR